MTFDDVIALLIMAAFAFLFALDAVVRAFRRLNRARPAARSRIPRTDEPPPRRRAERAVEPARPRKREERPKPARAPSLERRLFRGRRLSGGARLVVASEILSRPKALRRRTAR